LKGQDRAAAAVRRRVSKYHDFVTGRLERGAVAALEAAGVARRQSRSCACRAHSNSRRGALAARRRAGSTRSSASGCWSGRRRTSITSPRPCAQGLTGTARDRCADGVRVLTTNSIEEALERAVDGPSNKGWEAARRRSRWRRSLRI
jgi:hypothetical protein